jgi:predicted DNA-binding protein YlxM (UPF0122 family)
MTPQQLEQVKGYIAAGYNMNQVAAMMMISKVAIEAALATPASVVEKKTTKKIETTIEPMFEEEEGL